MAKVRIEKFNTDGLQPAQRAGYEYLRRQPEMDDDYLQPLSGFTDYTDYARKLAEVVDMDWVDCDKGRVPTEYWWIYNESGNIIGTAKTRYALNGELLHLGGHIRLGIDKQYRGLGYGRAALERLIEIVREHGVQDILLTVCEDNEPAVMLAEAVGGEFWSDVKVMDVGDSHLVYYARYFVLS